MAEGTEEDMRKAFLELQSHMVAIAQEQAEIENQLDGKRVAQRKLELTIKELSTIPDDTRCYTSVGRMFVHQEQAEIRDDLKRELKQCYETLTDLDKKKAYLQKMMKEKEANIQELLMTRARMQAAR